MNKNKRNTLLAVLVVIGLIILALFIAPKPAQPEPIEEDIVEPVIESNPQPERQLWLSNKAINSDYQGEVVFDSGLVNKSFVQAKDTVDSNGNLYHFYTEWGSLVTNPEGYTGNDVYIWTNWKDMTYDYNILGGSVFMEYKNEWSDQNIIIYGHHFSEGGGNDPERIKSFTPLEKLLKKDNFEGNDTLKLILDNETRSYKIVGVYIFDMMNDEHWDNGQYFRTNYNYEYSGNEDKGYYDKYIDFLNKNKLYDTGETLTNTDKTLTLQTCIGGSTTELEIVVCKQVDVTTYTD